MRSEWLEVLIDVVLINLQNLNIFKDAVCYCVTVRCAEIFFFLSLER